MRADDSGVDRGDGCFEGCRIQTDAAGRSSVDKLPAHLARMRRSAATLDIPFDEAAWRSLIDTALDACRTPGEYGLKLVLTRGPADGVPTGLLTARTLADSVWQQRRDGLRVITLDRGFTGAAFAEAPWLLGGVKTLSYAVNMAAIREAERRGADDADLRQHGRRRSGGTDGVWVWATTEPCGDAAGPTRNPPRHHSATARPGRGSGLDNRDRHSSVATCTLLTLPGLISSVRGPVDVVELDGKGRSRDLPVLAEIARFAGFPPAAR